MSEPETGQLRGDAPAGESPIATYTNATCSLAEDFYQPVDSIYYFRDGDGKIVDIYDAVAPVDTQVVFECKVKGTLFKQQLVNFLVNLTLVGKATNSLSSRIS